MSGWWWLVLVVTCWALAYHGAGAWVWAACVAALLGVLHASDGASPATMTAWWAAFAVFAAICLPTPLRRHLLAAPLLALFRRILPQMSQTEQEALDAGTVWWDGELFSGKPDWKKLLACPKPALSVEEQAFVDGPLRELCAMLDDWKITHELHDLPPAVWQFIKDAGFLGMIIPKQYGGKGFSALAHSEVVMRLSTRSGTAAVSVMVPNSLGPAELLLHYGTEAQKNHYLPRLARGLEMPCFALTSPEAGSDAGGIPDYGVVCRDGQGVLGIRLNWEKRYITLGPVATLLGLAFRLYDPEHLLGTREDVGITLALIPTATPGVEIGRRHLPLNIAFMNGPTWGRDVFVPMDCVIGGVAQAGQGWKMLMNCLAAGRSISLPANAVGIAKLCALTGGAYARVRTQFKLPIGRFEGVMEALARIGGNTYIMDAARVMTAGAVDAGEKPSVVSAIVKYHLTERGRAVINDAMDVHGGKGICMGPSNYLARAYQSVPIAITVEGANILTRTMIIFGQGAIRGHPWVVKEIAATREPDGTKALAAFDTAFFGHAGFVVTNFARALFLGLTRGRGLAVPGGRDTRRYYQQLTRLSAAFALTADFAMFVLGSGLKRRERLSARLGDILSQMYLASAALKRFEDDGRPADDLPLMHWSVRDAFYRIDEAFYALFVNMPRPGLCMLLHKLLFPYGREFKPPRDLTGHRIVGLLLEPGAARARLTAGAFVPDGEDEAVGALEAALRAAIAAEPAEVKIRATVRAGRLAETADAAAAQAAGVVDATEAAQVAHARALRRRVIMVDDFPRDFGASEITQTTQPVSFEALQRR